MKKIILLLLTLSLFTLSSCQFKKCVCSYDNVVTGTHVDAQEEELEGGQSCKELEVALNMPGVVENVSCKEAF